jgi:CO/xanthine dehydrogenase Mo-binding subunit
MPVKGRHHFWGYGKMNNSAGCMRAPGEAESMFAIESVMDELAFKLNMGALQLRMITHADTDPGNGNPWSSKELKQCYIRGAECFGGSKRNHTPRSMRNGDPPPRKPLMLFMLT